MSLELCSIMEGRDHRNKVIVVHFVFLFLDLSLRNFNGNVRRNFAVKPLAYGSKSWFYLSLEHFSVISMLDKSRDHGKLLSIC